MLFFLVSAFLCVIIYMYDLMLLLGLYLPSGGGGEGEHGIRCGEKFQVRVFRGNWRGNSRHPLSSLLFRVVLRVLSTDKRSES